MSIQRKAGILVLSLVVFAGVAYPYAALAARGCPVPLMDVVYSASFQNDRKIMINVGSRGLATITVGTDCLAVCRLKKDQSKVANDSGSMVMRCRNPLLGSMETEAIIFSRKEARKHTRAILRSGSWLRGYQNSNLVVHYDGSVKKRLLLTRHE